ncbi:MAG TPA: carboxypeptidase-like regulatory domain-containing protein [bacterium]|nr:carboxypeptidase-like regulatory domain-containing protein [bacterium]
MKTHSPLSVVIFGIVAVSVLSAYCSPLTQVPVSGKVIDLKDQGIPDVRIEFIPFESVDILEPRYRVTSDAEGEFRIDSVAVGFYIVTFHAEGYARPFVVQFHSGLPILNKMNDSRRYALPYTRRFLSGLLYETVVIFPDMSDLVFEMRPGMHLAGTVKNREGKPLAGANLIATRESTPGGRWPYAYNTPKVSETKTNENGRFEFTNLRPGKVSLIVSHPDTTVLWPYGFGNSFLMDTTTLSSYNIEVGRRDVEITLLPGRSLSGKVQDKNGEPVKGIEVTAETDKFTGNPLTSATATTDSEGCFVFRHLPCLTVTVHVSQKTNSIHDSVCRERIEEGESDIKNVVLKIPASEVSTQTSAQNINSGYFVDTEFLPLPGLSVYSSDYESGMVLRATTGEDGFFHFDEGLLAPIDIYVGGIPGNRPGMYVPPTKLTGDASKSTKKQDPLTGKTVLSVPIERMDVLNPNSPPTIQVETIPFEKRFQPITGIVRGIQGNPLPDIPVVCLLELSSFDVEKIGGERILSTRTDDQGHFRFDKTLIGLDYRIVAQAVRRNRFVSTMDWIESGTTDPREITLCANSNLIGRAVSDNGTPAEKFTIEMQGKDRDASDYFVTPGGFSFDNEHGEFSIFNISPGLYTMKVFSDMGTAKYGPIEVDEGTDVTGVEISLTQTQSISGTIQGPAGPVKNASLQITFPHFLRFVPTTAALADSVPSRNPVFSDEDGRFVIPNAPNAALQIKISHPDHAGMAFWLNPDEFSVEKNITLTNGGTIAGTVRDVSGQPVTDGGICFYDYSSDYRFQTTLDNKGFFEFHHVPPGEYSVEYLDKSDLRMKGFMFGIGSGMSYDLEKLSRKVPGVRCEVKEGETTRIKMQSGFGSIVGQVTYKGQPVENAEITGETDEHGLSGYRLSATRTDREGRYRFDRIPAWDWTIHCRAGIPSSSEGKLVASKKGRVCLQPGQEVICDFEVLPTRIFGRAYIRETGEPLAERMIFIDRNAGFVRYPIMVRTDKDGNYSIDGCDPGLHLLEVEGPEKCARFQESVELTDSEPIRKLDLALTTQFGRIVGDTVERSTSQPVEMTSVRCVDMNNADLQAVYPLHTAVSGKDALYRMDHIAPGYYLCVARADQKGLAVAVQPDIVVEPDRATNVEFQLKKGSLVGFVFCDDRGRRMAPKDARSLEVRLTRDNEWTIPGSIFLSDGVVGGILLEPGNYTVTAWLNPEKKVEKKFQVKDVDPPRAFHIVVPR